jgi:chromosome partitioning protein
LPRIACIQKFGRGIARELRDLADRYQDIIVDTGGRDSVELRGALVVADVIAIPVQASQLDLWTMDQIDKVIQEARALNPALRASVIISRAPTHPHMTDVADAKDLLNDFTSLQLVSVVIRERVAYRRAAGAGCSVHEFPPRDEAACAEITDLYTELYEPLK